MCLMSPPFVPRVLRSGDGVRSLVKWQGLGWGGSIPGREAGMVGGTEGGREGGRERGKVCAWGHRGREGGREGGTEGGRIVVQ